MMMRLASPHRRRPQVFSTSRRFTPPRACWPCFVPDPLMGLCPSELCSPHRAVRRLQRRAPPDVWYAPSNSTSNDVRAGRGPCSHRRNRHATATDLRPKPKSVVDVAQRHRCLTAARTEVRAARDRRGHALSRGHRSASRPNMPCRTASGAETPVVTNTAVAARFRHPRRNAGLFHRPPSAACFRHPRRNAGLFHTPPRASLPPTPIAETKVPAAGPPR